MNRIRTAKIVIKDVKRARFNINFEIIKVTIHKTTVIP
jgi:hypothetical protein|tara:strand:+ start:715 stop:828 length:114 start_codon:yes stop_codon:yes gene_type:complete